MRDGRWRIVLLPLLCAVACSASPHRSAASDGLRHTPILAPPSRDNAGLERTQPGRRVPLTTVSLPARAIAGTTLVLRAPPGSDVDAFGVSHRVPDSGRLGLVIPLDVAGRIPIRVQRPALPVLLLQVHVTSSAP